MATAHRARKERRKRRLDRRVFAGAATLLCIISIAYFFWPRIEFVQVRGGITIIDGFYSLRPDFTDAAVGFFGSHDLTVDLYKDLDVVVDFYRKLPALGYTLVVLRVHAGILGRDSAAPTFLFTNEPYETGKYFLEQMTEQILGGRIDSYSNERKSFFAVGPVFVTMSMNGNFNNSIVILSSCLGLFRNETARAFIEKGARAFIGWDEKVDLQHTDKACTLLLRLLVEEKKTIGEAVNTVMAEVGPDRIYGSRLRYYPQNATNVRVAV